MSPPIHVFTCEEARDIHSPGAGITNTLVVGVKSRSSGRADRALNCQAIPPVPCCTCPALPSLSNPIKSRVLTVHSIHQDPKPVSADVALRCWRLLQKVELSPRHSMDGQAAAMSADKLAQCGTDVLVAERRRARIIFLGVSSCES